MGYKEDITKIYVGYYDRAPDPVGLQYWIDRAQAGMTLSEIAQSFSVQPESTAKYPYLKTPDVVSAESFIKNVYNNLFNRDPDAEGQAYWLAQLAGGKPVGQMIIDIMSGATDSDAGKDKTILENKVEVGIDWATDVASISGFDYENNASAKASAAAVLDGVTDDPATVTAAKAETDTFVSTGGGAGQSFTLTKGVDTLVGGNGGDTFIADATVDATSTVADSIDGGAGNDTFRLYVDDTNTTVLPGTIKNVENIEIFESGEYNDADDFSVAGATGLKTVTLNGGKTDDSTAANERFTLTVGADQEVVLKGIKDGNVSDVANEEGEFEIASSASVTSLDLTVEGVGASTSDLDIDVAGSGVTTLNVKSQGSSNYVGLINEGGALKTLNVSGDKTFDASKDAVSTLTTVDASTATGAVKVNILGSTLDVNLKGGAGDDVFVIGADLDDKDTVDGGAGRDAVMVSSAALNSASTAVGKGIAALTNIEVVGSLETANDGVIIDATKFTNVHEFAVGGGGALTPASQAGAGDNAVTFTFANDDTLVVGANITGGESTGANGGDAINAAASVNSGSDILNLKFEAGAATTVTGGAETGAGTLGGDGLDASSVETINISTASASDDVTFAGGTGSTAAGASVKVGANATVNITGAGDVNLGTIVDQGVAVDDLTINGSAMTGKLTVTTGAGNDTITGGSKGDSITAGTGTNTVTGNGGSDTFNFADDSSTASAITTITDFEVGAGKDKIAFTTAAGTFEALTSASKTALASATSLAEALEAVNDQLSEHEATVFVYGGDAYVVYEEATQAGNYVGNEGDYTVVKLAGITDVSGFDATQIA